MIYGFEKTLNNNKILQKLRIVLRFAIFYDKQKLCDADLPEFASSVTSVISKMNENKYFDGLHAEE